MNGNMTLPLRCHVLQQIRLLMKGQAILNIYKIHFEKEIMKFEETKVDEKLFDRWSYAHDNRETEEVEDKSMKSFSTET